MHNFITLVALPPQKFAKSKLIPEGKRSLGRMGADGKMILRWILKKQSGRCGLSSSASGYEPVGDSCE
jgi:hypothetical protein